MGVSHHYLDEYEKKNLKYQKLKEKYDKNKKDFASNCINNFYSTYQESTGILKKKFEEKSFR